MATYFKRMAGWVLGGFAIVFLVIVLFLTSIEKVAFDLNFYQNEYKKLNVAQATGMSHGELMKTTQELLNYLKDQRKDLNIVSIIQGKPSQVFNQREIGHMVDVKDLFTKGMGLRAVSIGGFLASIALLYWTIGNKIYQYLTSSFLWVFGVMFFLAIVLVILIYQDFTPIWDQFHYLFFSNDLWQLDPETDILIRMVPEEFFFDTVRRILSLFGAGMVILFIPALINAIRVKN